MLTRETRTVGRTLLRTLCVGLVLVLVGWALRPADAETIEDDELNYILLLPPGWSRQPQAPAWGKLHIVASGMRALDKLANPDEKPDGQGAVAELAVLPAPEGKSLDELAADPEVRSFLLQAFREHGAPEPKVSLASDQYDKIPVRFLTADGKANNLKGKLAPAHGELLLAVVRGRLYELRLYAWPSDDRDAEGLKADLSFIESQFTWPDTKPLPVKPDKPPPPTEQNTPEQKPVGDEAEAVPLKGTIGEGKHKIGWELVKPVGLRSKTDYDKKTYDTVVAWFEANERDGAYQIMLYVMPHGRKNPVTGLKVGDVHAKIYLDPWWENFKKAHSEGPIVTFDWPRRSDFLSLPDWTAERMVAETPDKRAEKANMDDLIKKLHVVEKMRKFQLGREKIDEAYRGVLMGSGERGVGRDRIVQYFWETPQVSCYFFVEVMREGLTKWEKPINELLSSFKFTGRVR